MTRTKAVGELDSFSSDLKCSLCDKLFTDPVVVSCCNTAFCKECKIYYVILGITFSLLENADIAKRFKCPSCSQYQSPEHLKIAPRIAEAVANAISKSKANRQSNLQAETTNSMDISPKSEEYAENYLIFRTNKKRALSPDRNNLKANKSLKLDQ